MNFFKPEDFSFKDDYTNSHAAIDANEKLQREAKVVYGVYDSFGKFISSQDVSINDTHKALLVCIEEIERRHCEHEVKSGLITYPGRDDVALAVCHKCGVKLKAKWEVVE